MMVDLETLLGCLPAALSKKYFLHSRWWESEQISLRRCCAFPDCGAFIPPECIYPVEVYGPEAPRRMFCLACRRDSEFPEEGKEPPVLAEDQTRFPWFPAGHPMLLPAGSLPSMVLMHGSDPFPEPVRDIMPLLRPLSPSEWQITEVDAIDLAVFVDNAPAPECRRHWLATELDDIVHYSKFRRGERRRFKSEWRWPITELDDIDFDVFDNNTSPGNSRRQWQATELDDIDPMVLGNIASPFEFRWRWGVSELNNLDLAVFVSSVECQRHWWVTELDGIDLFFFSLPPLPNLRLRIPMTGLT